MVQLYYPEKTLSLTQRQTFELRDRSYDTRMSVPTGSPVTPRDTDAMVTFSFAAAQPFIAHFPLDGSQYLALPTCPECDYGGINHISASAGPCLFLGLTGTIFEIPGNSGGETDIGPPQSIISAACGVVLHN